MTNSIYNNQTCKMNEKPSLFIDFDSLWEKIKFSERTLSIIEKDDIYTPSITHNNNPIKFHDMELPLQPKLDFVFNSPIIDHFEISSDIDNYKIPADIYSYTHAPLIDTTLMDTTQDSYPTQSSEIYCKEDNNINYMDMFQAAAHFSGKATFNEALCFKNWYKVNALSTGKISVKDALRFENIDQEIAFKNGGTVEEAIAFYTKFEEETSIQNAGEFTEQNIDLN